MKKKIKKQKTFSSRKKASQFWWMNCQSCKSSVCWTCWECTEELSLVSEPTAPLRDLVKTSFFPMFQYPCVWQLSNSRDHDWARGTFICVRILVYAYTQYFQVLQLPSHFQGSFDICQWNRSSLFWRHCYWSLIIKPVSQNVFIVCPRKRKCFREMHGFVKKGGSFLFCSSYCFINQESPFTEH